MSQLSTEVKKQTEQTEILTQEQRDLALLNACGANYSYGISFERIKSLIDQRANVNKRDSARGATPLMWLCFPGTRTYKTIEDNIQCMELLVTNKADVNAPNNDSMTPLMWATIAIGPGDLGETHIPYIKFLLENKANINACDRLGWTALHYAVRDNMPVMALTLLETNASCHIKGNNGTPLNYALSTLSYWSSNMFSHPLAPVDDRLSSLAFVTKILDFWTQKTANGPLDLMFSDVVKKNDCLSRSFRLTHKNRILNEVRDQIKPLCFQYKQKFLESNINFPNAILNLILSYVICEDHLLPHQNLFASKVGKKYMQKIIFNVETSKAYENRCSNAR